MWAARTGMPATTASRREAGDAPVAVRNKTIHSFTPFKSRAVTACAFTYDSSRAAPVNGCEEHSAEPAYVQIAFTQQGGT